MNPLMKSLLLALGIIMGFALRAQADVPGRFDVTFYSQVTAANPVGRGSRGMQRFQTAAEAPR